MIVEFGLAGQDKRTWCSESRYADWRSTVVAAVFERSGGTPHFEVDSGPSGVRQARESGSPGRRI
jgi:hypothetical protein